MAVVEGAIDIRSEGVTRKFLTAVEQITFSGARASRLEQPVLYVTERCVFELSGEGLKLVEIAPGIDLERDILAQMSERPVIGELRIMDDRIFQEREMDLRIDLLHLKLPERIAVDAKTGQLFLNFEKMRVRSIKEILRVEQLVSQTCEPLGARVDVVANYDGFQIDEMLEAEWARMVARLTERYYENVSRYSGSAFMRMKLQKVFPNARTHIFETGTQARSFLETK